MAIRFAVGAVVTGALVCLSYGYTVVRAPNPPPPLPPPHIAMVGFTQPPLHQPQFVVPETATCYALLTVPLGLKCHPPGRYVAQPESLSRPPAEIIVGGQRRVVPAPKSKVTIESIKAGKSTTETIK